MFLKREKKRSHQIFTQLENSTTPSVAGRKGCKLAYSENIVQMNETSNRIKAILLSNKVADQGHEEGKQK